MSKPFVIKYLTGAIATIVVYLRGKNKLTTERQEQIRKMAESKSRSSRKKDKPTPPAEPEESEGYPG